MTASRPRKPDADTRHLGNPKFNAHRLDFEASKILKEKPLMEVWVSHDGSIALLRTGEQLLTALASRLRAPRKTPIKKVSEKTAALGLCCKQCGGPRARSGAGLCSACWRGNARTKFSDFAELAAGWDDARREVGFAEYDDERGLVMEPIHYDSDTAVYGSLASEESEE